ncbi:hypothetical protein [Paenibacillus sp. FSL H8-0283]|uniref:hypothetical protein n=1 Tax=Paenibacillus sp. FSL H8-0283 TaxID=2921383 RepID=UPI0032475866
MRKNRGQTDIKKKYQNQDEKVKKLIKTLAKMRILEEDLEYFHDYFHQEIQSALQERNQLLRRRKYQLICYALWGYQVNLVQSLEMAVNFFDESTLKDYMKKKLKLDRAIDELVDIRNQAAHPNLDFVGLDILFKKKTSYQMIQIVTNHLTDKLKDKYELKNKKLSELTQYRYEKQMKNDIEREKEFYVSKIENKFKRSRYETQEVKTKTIRK